MTFQETHVSDNTLSIINTQFQARYSLWIRRCGIVSFSPSFIFSDNLAPKNDRMIFTKVKHPYNAFVTFWLLVLYVPATSGRQRQQFFDQVLHLLHNQDLDINFDRLFITGDFNYSYLRPKLSSQTSIQKNDATYSTINHIFVNQAFRTQVIESNLHRLNASWTDHSLLSATCCLDPSPSGPGLWWGNPLLARKPAYQQCHRQHLDHILLNIHSGWNTQKKWDFVKRQVKKVTCSFAIGYSNWRRRMIRQLQSDRNRFLCSKSPTDVRLQRLIILDQQIASLQQELSEILALKANVRWQEADHLLEPICNDKIIHKTALVENKSSSPGEDGLGYGFLYQLFRYPPLQFLILQVYNQALNSHTFHTSWQGLKIRLLAKKGDLTSLQNWRPISLINCDAKIYTRIINSRMRQVISPIINRCQTGFMPNHFIAENRLVLNMVMGHARRCNRNDIALLLDQEEAYGRVNPSYFRVVILKLGFPSVLINSLIGLFFGNRVRINVNVHFTNEINQCRGLYQGDPLSPILFKLALEPFLRHIIQGNSVLGFSFTPLSSKIPPPSDLKVLSYADDVCVFLSSPEGFVRVQYHLHIYGQVPNTKVNLSKTEAIFLNGCTSPSWQQTLLQYQVVKWHNHTKPQPLRYLEFIVIQSLAHHTYAEERVSRLQKAKKKSELRDVLKNKTGVWMRRVHDKVVKISTDNHTLKSKRKLGRILMKNNPYCKFDYLRNNTLNFNGAEIGTMIQQSSEEDYIMTDVADI
ncbi:hypothetical protein G6F46_011585 [Rhizopus delemar]|uniref:Reverse transcriptase domain-containing protein n=2 Tax=Rhizopus TaxID=4842 RepID=A0A9P7CJ94_9FUNG|nr:hypothetical protein G6F55_006815 [Rhizopus delemar]KAG1540621.1 hypothetical protein G6F51_008410 [Rhizopus arrhizus]KAG1493212.1 hypothetical protein G6F54_008742 [Rhizopus delemar]KAG1510158.1 hypothetical protein G6F53_006892 [Rhizopus delemar]KAG1515953.1 hypothetical protein G6F52_009560 [Rhizopus delemar]